jgi:hypothetical protein
MTLPAALNDLLHQQEALEAKRTHIVIALESGGNSAKFEDEALMFLQMILGNQVHIAKQLLEECANITCERVEWPQEIRA